MKHKTNIADTSTMRETFEALQGTELQQEEFPELLEWDDYVAAAKTAAADDRKLQELLRMTKDDQVVTELTLQALLQLSFYKAKEIVDRMSIAKRILMLEELDEYKLYLYDCADQFAMDGVPKEERMTAKEFRAILGRIKHLEIVQNWLFGIV